MPYPYVHCNHRNQPVSYSVARGFAPALTMQADADWQLEKMKILREIYAAYPTATVDANELGARMQEYNLADWHWSWNRKAFSCIGTGYEWFYLIADGRVQAICVILFPKASRLHGDNIFYVDYLAVAHWNRNRPNYVRQFEKLGSILLASCIGYAMDTLKFRPGFCLHSLPTAEAFYLHLGLTDFGNDPDKENLKFFEANENVSIHILSEYRHA